jgi:hypothetical protein
MTSNFLFSICKKENPWKPPLLPRVSRRLVNQELRMEIEMASISNLTYIIPQCDSQELFSKMNFIQ